MRWPIRTQLLLPIVVLLLAVAAISVTTAAAAAAQAREQLEARLRSVARFIAEDSQFPLTRDVLRQLRPLSGADYLVVPATGGRRTSLETDPGEIPLPEPVSPDWHNLHLGTPLEIQGRTYFCAAIQLIRGPNSNDTLYILYPEHLWRDARYRAILPSIILGLSAGLLSLGLALTQAQRLGRRIHELERRTRLIAGGDFSPMPLPRRNDEIRDLTISVNEMAQQLAKFEHTTKQTERLRLLGQVSGGLAHQLRNGLTGARLAVQLYLSEIDPGQDVAALTVALRQLKLLEAHVRRFLDLGRAEPARREQCDLKTLVSEAVELLGPQCKHAAISLTWIEPALACVVDGDPGQLGQLILNLLGNAIDAAGPGGSIQVAIHAEARSWALEVCDSGAGPDPSLMDRLFEPFVTSKPEGVGLGLAVARQVAEGHGGQIGWHREANRTCFRVVLPALSPAKRAT